MHQLNVLTAEEWIGKMNTSSVSTTESPNGTTELKRQRLPQLHLDNLDNLNYTIKHSYSFEQQQKVTTIMIREEHTL
jgi:hypothetical protein